MERGYAIGRYEPDSILASVMASMSFEDVVTIFNGPRGCYNMDAGYSRRCVGATEGRMDSRTECMFIEDEDYIFGSTERVRRAVEAMNGEGYRLITVIDSPGASMTGDTRGRLRNDCGVPVLHMKNLYDGIDFVRGYDDAVSQIIRRSDEPAIAEGTPRLCLLGCPPSYIGWRGSVGELRALFAICGIDVVATPGCGGSFSDLNGIRRGDFCTSIVSEFVDASMKTLTSRGLNGIDTEGTVPIGFTFTAEWVVRICEAMGKDPRPAVEIIRRRSKSASATIRGAYLKDSLEDRTFCVSSVRSVEDILSDWLEDYLGMTRCDISHLDSCDFVFGDGYLTEQVNRSGRKDVRGIPLEFLKMSRTMFVPRQLFACDGCLYLLDEIFQGL